MSVVWEFRYITPPGQKFIYLYEWIKTLSAAEQEEFKQAQQQQENYRQEKIDDGNLIITGNNRYIWKDQETATVNKPTDRVWQYYFERYLVETGIKFEKIEIKV